MRASLATISLLALALSACGGGGGSAGVQGDAGTGPAASHATVSVLITDAPTAGWDQAIATITSVELIGGSGKVSLFSGSRTVDLLRLRDFSELFAVSDQVPAGSYSKIRLQLADLVLNRLDDGGHVVESTRPQLVGNGKIDLNPRGPFTLSGGDVIFVELDFDMDKALKLTTTGNGKIILRPVVFVNIRTAQLGGRLTRIHGEITDIDAVDGALRLCQSRFASGGPDVQPLHAGQDADDDDHDDDEGNHDPAGTRCVTVRSDAATGIFDADGLPQDFAGLAVGEEATVVGRLRPLDPQPTPHHDDDDFGYDHRLALDAVVIEEGPLGTYRRIAGVANSGVDSSQVFGLDVAAGQGFGTGTMLPVQLFDSSRIFNRAGHELQPADIRPGVAALADGVLQIGSSDLLRSPLVILDAGPAPGAAQIEGPVVDIDTVEHSLRVNDGSADRCVDAAQAAIFEVTSGDGFSSSRVGLGDLVPGQQVSVFGVERLDGCLAADTIIADGD